MSAIGTAAIGERCEKFTGIRLRGMSDGDAGRRLNMESHPGKMMVLEMYVQLGNAIVKY